MSVRSVTLLGSTGSIGTQAIDVISRHPDRFRVDAISAGGANADLLARQAIELGVARVGVADPARAADVEAALAAQAPRAGARPVEVLVGPDAATDLAGAGSDVVLNGITGFDCLVLHSPETIERFNYIYPEKWLELCGYFNRIITVTTQTPVRKHEAK